MPGKLTTIAFDADDTLWHNERFFKLTQERFVSLLADYADPAVLDAHLLEVEGRNLGRYGYGIKGFLLSMIESAIELTEARIPSSVLQEILAIGHDMLEHPIDLLPHAREAVEAAKADHMVLLITKGDLLDQERKLAQSGLGDLFDGVEIVSEKMSQTYSSIFSFHGDGPARSMMVGNSLKSDVRPAIEAGAWGVHVPFGLTWALDHAEPPLGHPRFCEVPDLGSLPDLLADLR
ncbi:HAD family hydrolase [Actibacterium sp. 188UL27-1]|uniref:HAD family hydrolase n=1 Tax=Actibacterium sp. 188UL27-1 TaxID=2786961 RepID=UPI0019594B77|nr:HAD family hydrolase [Actibacterium sp. 188UL27-1]MBM7069481.1 HAD family hydrolase [Actibacterium sp. 188UL27-1]